MKGFSYYYLGYFVRPQRAYESLMKDDRRVRFAVLAVSVPAAGFGGRPTSASYGWPANGPLILVRRSLSVPRSATATFSPALAK